MTPVRPTLARRCFAALVAAGMLAAFAPPAHGAVAASGHCAHPLPAGALAWTGPSSAGPCHGGTGAACAVMPQCAATTPALVVWTTGPQFAFSSLVSSPSSPVPAHGRVAAGPPTPPPNR